jgi:hypothetical protein
MDSLLRALSDPGAWVSNIVFGLAAALIWKISACQVLVVRFFGHRGSNA